MPLPPINRLAFTSAFAQGSFQFKEIGWSDDGLDEYKARSIAAVADGGSTLLDEYIAERFELVVQYDEYMIMWRKDAPGLDHATLDKIRSRASL